MTPTNAKIQLPGSFSTAVPTVTYTHTDVNSATIKVAYMFQVPKTGTLDKAEFLSWAGTAINSASVVRVSFQNASTTNPGPDETQDQYRDISGSVLGTPGWVVPGLMTSDGTDGGAKRSVTRGDVLCFVVEFQTFNTGDVFAVALATITSGYGGPFSWPASTRKNVTWGFSNGRFVMALKYSDGTYERVCPVAPIGSTTGRDLTSSSVDQGGILFRVPLALTIDGVFSHISPNNNSADFRIILLTAANVELINMLIDATTLGVSSRAGGFWPLTTPITLLANTNYRLIIKAVTTNLVTLIVEDFASEAIKKAAAGEWKWTERTGSGAWTDTATRIAQGMGFQISAVGDAPSAIYPRSFGFAAGG